MNIPLYSLLAAGLLMTTAVGSTPQPNDRDWNFTVYLDDDPVGHHRFTLTETEAMRKLRSEARFTVKVLMIEAYRYAHESNENWQGDCLATIDARTDDNGDQSSVQGNARDGRFELKKGVRAETLPACIMTFAYWNPLMLKQSRLLNPQTGDYTTVRIAAQGREMLPVRGQPVSTDKYHLDAGKFQIDLWYADGGRWVGLDSLLDNGRKLRYRME